jgi:putative ABC transport system permease protein
MNISIWTLAARQLWRDLRAGELRLLLLAVTLAVAALTSVGFFADRLQAGLQRDAQQLLGGDAVVQADQPLPAWVAQRARDLGLRVATTLTFPTIARAPDSQGGQIKLVALKAVEPPYPLRGQLRIATASQADGVLIASGPPPGQVWVDPGLLDALGLRVGDALLLGERSLTISQLLLKEPDRGASFVNFSPRVMMHQADLAATALVQPASRIRYRLAVAGDASAVRQFIATVEQRQSSEGVRGMRLEALENGRPEISNTLARAEKFLNLVALLAALLSAVAVALAARSFASRHLDDCAMLRVLGLSQRTMALSYALEFAALGVLASLSGLLLGLLVHQVFELLLAHLLSVTLPMASAWPALFGLGVGLTLMLAFGLPPVLQLARVPPVRVIRRELGTIKPASLVVWALGLAGFAALLLITSRDPALGSIAVGGFAGAALVFALLSWLAVKAVRGLVNDESASTAVVLASRQLAASPGAAVVQISSLAMGLLALVLLVLLRTDLINSWRAATPADAPNRFVINVLPEQSPDFQGVLTAAGVRDYDWYPMIRGRLVAINNQAIGPEQYSDARAQRLVDREFNLSHAAELPRGNQVVAGRWQANEPGAISVEEGIAKTLGLTLGDRLTYDMAGALHTATITSLRKVDWGSMRANFFAIYPQASMPELSVTYMSAFRAPEQRGFDAALVRQFPNITTVDISATIAQVQDVLNQVIAAVEFLFGFTLVAGVVVLVAAIGSTRAERAHAFAVMRAVGASAALLRRVQSLELALVGLLAGVLASGVASAMGWALAHYVFEFTWVVSLWVPVLGALCGAALALLAGSWSLRGVVHTPVMQTLRQAAS